MYWRGVRVWRLSHGARATSDLLAAPYLPEEQAGQPELQRLSHPPLQLVSQLSSQ